MMNYIDPTLVVLVILALLGYISSNNTVAIAALALIIFRVTPLSGLFPWLQTNGLTIGILILTFTVMLPIASGKITINAILHSFVEFKSLLAVIVGVFVSWVGMRGVNLMSSDPTIVTGLVVGTLLGVAVFKGVPVGPLIAAGLVSLIIGKG